LPLFTEPRRRGILRSSAHFVSKRALARKISKIFHLGVSPTSFGEYAAAVT
jgi:hypothetical protein